MVLRLEFGRRLANPKSAAVDAAAMLAAEATACRPSTGTSYSSIIVSSAGGVGTTSLFHALGQVVPIINDENDEDKLKHATARQLQARGLPLRSAAPLLLCRGRVPTLRSARPRAS